MGNPRIRCLNSWELRFPEARSRAPVSAFKGVLGLGLMELTRDLVSVHANVHMGCLLVRFKTGSRGPHVYIIVNNAFGGCTK